jgi:hypothetical protein
LSFQNICGRTKCITSTLRIGYVVTVDKRLIKDVNSKIMARIWIQNTWKALASGRKYITHSLWRGRQGGQLRRTRYNLNKHNSWRTEWYPQRLVYVENIAASRGKPLVAATFCLNCTACHTSIIRVNAISVVADGGPRSSSGRNPSTDDDVIQLFSVQVSGPNADLASTKRLKAPLQVSMKMVSYLVMMQAIRWVLRRESWPSGCFVAVTDESTQDLFRLRLTRYPY